MKFLLVYLHSHFIYSQATQINRDRRTSRSLSRELDTKGQQLKQKQGELVVIMCVVKMVGGSGSCVIDIIKC